MTINCGIYIMYFECDNFQYYVGKSGNMKDRYYDHCRKLRCGTHINKDMQKLYYTYGYPTMEPIEEVLNLAEQSIREIYWISALDTFKNGLNGTIGGDDLGFGANTPTSLYSEEVYINILKELAITSKSLRTISEELAVSYAVVQKISNGSEHAWLELEYPEFCKIVRDKCGERKGLVYETEQYDLVVLLGADINNTIKYIIEATSLNESVVKNILYGSNHTDLAQKYPEEYKKMMSHKGKRRKGTSSREGYPKVISPKGDVYPVDNSRQFALQHNLQTACFHRLLQGKALSHKGWKLA